MEDSVMEERETERIAVIGAGPIGLEAALYGRFLGYEVEVFERGKVCEHLLQWGHVRLFSPFSMNASPLGVAALSAQSPDQPLPEPDELLTGRELAERYYLPLANSDLVRGRLHEGCEVIAVGRTGYLKGEAIGDADRGESPFRLLVRQPDGSEKIHEADFVIDATGTLATPNRLGDGGIPAVGETAAADRIDYDLPEILGQRRDDFSGRTTLVVGAGYSAATSIVALAELAADVEGTHVVWVDRKASVAPIACIANDRLTERDKLAAAANALAANSEGPVRYLPETVVAEVSDTEDSERLCVTLEGNASEEILVDRIIANVGYRPDHRLASELQIHQCYASDGPMKLAASLSQQPEGDCLDQQSTGPDSLCSPEPNYFILGSKSYGRNSNFLLVIGFAQIRDVFTLIGEREDLDLYINLSPATP